MIQRVVLVKLKPDYAVDAERTKMVEHSREVLARVSGVRGVSVGVPADRRKDWDVCILVRLDDMDAVETYRVDKTHRAYADAFLKPMMEKIRVWNFEVG